jgi:hypothetical protein
LEIVFANLHGGTFSASAAAGSTEKYCHPQKFDFPLIYLDHFIFSNDRAHINLFISWNVHSVLPIKLSKALAVTPFILQALPSESSGGNTKPDIFLVTSIF